MGAFKVMLVMDMEVPAFVQPVQVCIILFILTSSSFLWCFVRLSAWSCMYCFSVRGGEIPKNVWMAREDDTDECAKAHFPEETSAGALDILLCHCSCGQSDLLCCMLPVHGETS
ncbi:uncharacterized protein LOC122577403 [Bombus pyrosoma]|uniref:uncharacterized protein LOC122577403 n=1 Tax=Bombus pyrosoma TaxID=396416 RepID=UPI001CB90BD0|nr:uncharacterized protein LOC122577403 [Bombus pyrosoma]